MASHDIPRSRTENPAAPLRKAIAGLAVLAVAMGIGRFAFTPVLPMMLQDAGLSLAAGGLIASANYLGYLLGALSAMVIRVQPERAIRGGLLVIGMVTLAMSLSLPFAAWLVLRLAAGVASAWVLICVSAWCMGALAAYQRPFLNSLVFAGVGAGIAAAGLVCMALLGLDAGSSAAWAALGTLSLAVCAVVWRALSPQAAPGGAGTAGAPHVHERQRWDAQSVRLVGCYGIFGFGYIIPATFLPVMAKAELDSSLFGWSWPLFGLAAALSTLAVAALVRRVGNRPLWAACHFVMAAGIMLPVVIPGLPAVFAAAVGVGGTFMVITLAALQEAKRVAGRDPTVMMAAMTSAFAAGQIIGPLTVSAGGNARFSSGLIVAAILLVASALALMVKDAPRHA